MRLFFIICKNKSHLWVSYLVPETEILNCYAINIHNFENLCPCEIIMFTFLARSCHLLLENFIRFPLIYTFTYQSLNCLELHKNFQKATYVLKKTIIFGYYKVSVLWDLHNELIKSSELQLGIHHSGNFQEAVKFLTLVLL